MSRLWGRVSVVVGTALFFAVLAGPLGAGDMWTESGDVVAHSGGTDRNGCHHDRKNGDYHCH